MDLEKELSSMLNAGWTVRMWATDSGYHCRAEHPDQEVRLGVIEQAMKEMDVIVSGDLARASSPSIDWTSPVGGLEELVKKVGQG